LRYRVAPSNLPGKPDVVFPGAKLAVFCDGDFWHGRNLDARLAKLASGHNAPYWVAKIQRNVERDRRHNATLNELGWCVLRLWETDILKAPTEAADKVRRALTEASERRRVAGG
jgi:DNA mismatch endonuclease (patch repair protein)